MALSPRECPDCHRRVREPFEKTVTGRQVCPDCARALVTGTAVGVITGNVGSGYGVWAMLMRKIRRSRMTPRVTLAPFTADRLPAVQPWFRHPEVDRRLGGPQWPERELRLLDTGLGEMSRGRRVLRTHSWVALDRAGEVVAKVGGEVYDRWCRYTETPHGPVVDEVEAGPAMGLTYVVDPARWRQGFGVAALRATIAAPAVADVIVFAAGIDADNVASARCASAAGFRAGRSTPDAEGTIYYLLRR